MTHVDEKEKLLFHLIESNDEVRFKDIAEKYSKSALRKIFYADTGFNLLHWAALKGAYLILTWLLDKMHMTLEHDNNFRQWTPLHLAAIKGQSMCLDALIIRKPDLINKKDKIGCTPIHLAAAHGRMHCLKSMLHNSIANPDVNRTCSNRNTRWTPIMYATWHGRISCVELLVRHGAALDLSDANGRTVLHLAVESGNKALVRYFLQEGRTNMASSLKATDNFGFTPFNLAANYKKNEIMGLLKEKIENPLTWETVEDIAYPAHLAVMRNDLEKVKDLINTGSIRVNDVDQRGYTLLHKAVVVNAILLVKFLLQQGASIYLTTLSGETALDIAVRKNHEKIIDILTLYKSNLKGTSLVSKDGNQSIETDGKVYVPVLTNLDADFGDSELNSDKIEANLKEKQQELAELETRISATMQNYTTEEDKYNLLKSQSQIYSDSDRTDAKNEAQRTLANYELRLARYKQDMMMLQHQVHIVKFGIYQLTQLPTPKEMELSEALRESQRQHDEIFDNLFYERQNREELEAELSRLHLHILKIRKYIMTNDLVPDELLNIIISFQHENEKKVEHRDVLVEPEDTNNQVSKYSVHFHRKPMGCITVDSLSCIPKCKIPIDTKALINMTQPKFLQFIKKLIKCPSLTKKCSKRKKIKTRRLRSPHGGVFVV